MCGIRMRKRSRKRRARISMQRIGQVSSRRLSLAGLALAVFLSGEIYPASQPMRSDEGFLVVVLLKAQVQRDQAGADLEAVEMELQTNKRMIQDAEERLAIAIETRNRQAGLVPASDLRSARAARRKILRTRTLLEQTRARAEDTYAVVRKMLVSGERPEPDSRILGMVSSHSGSTVILKKDGRKVVLEGEKPGFIEPGDEVSTNGAGRAEVQALDGRGLIQLDGRSRLRIEEDTPQKQALRLIQGRIYSVVDRPEDLERKIRDRIEGPDDDLTALLRRYQGLAGPESAQSREKNLQIRLPEALCSVTGARFSIEVKNEGTTEIIAIEGAVDVSDLRGEKHVLVEEGYRVTVTKNGISEPLKIPSSAYIATGR
jgi:hypothetical protein